MNDTIFDDLRSAKPTVASTLQPLVPTLVELFNSLQSKLSNDIRAMLNNTVESMKRECLAIFQSKDDIIEAQNKEIRSLKERCENTDAYERRDAIIISGSVPGVVNPEDKSNVVVDLINRKFPSLDMKRSDISISHRLQAKRPNSQGVTFPPNIYVKLVRREMKRNLIDASRKQPKEDRDKIYVNESLTPKRSQIRQSLLNMKKQHGDIVRGVTSFEGDVFVYTPQSAEPGASRDGRRPKDKRHRVNNEEELRDFCREFIKKPLDLFLSTWQRS